MIIAKLRRPDGVYELHMERVEAFSVPKVGEGLDLVGQYVERVVPLDLERSKALYPELVEALLAVEAGVFEPSLLEHVREVVDHTIPERAAFSKGLAWPRLEKEAKKIAPTAAHPRGFRGTKAQPPVPMSPKPFDLFPYLDGGVHEAGVFTALLGFGPLDLVRMKGWSAENVEAFAKLPADFHRHFGWHLQIVDWKQAAWLVPLYWDLNLREETSLKRLIAMMLHRDGLTRRLSWVESMRVLTPARRTAFAELLFELRVGTDTEGELEPMVARLDQLCTDDNFRSRAHYLLSQPWDVTIAGEVLAQIELLNDFYPRGTLSEVEPSVGGALAVHSVMVLLQDAEDDWAGTGYCALLLETCGDFDGFVGLLTDFPLEVMGADVAYTFLSLITSQQYLDCGWRATEEKWAWMRKHVSGWARSVIDVEPEYRCKYLRYLSQFLWEWDSPVDLQCRLGPTVAWATRLCSRPFLEEAVGVYALSRIPQLLWSSIIDALEAPDAALLSLEKVARRDNDDSLTGFGLLALALSAPDLVLTGLRSGSGALAATAKTLGSARRADGIRIVGDVCGGALFKLDPSARSTEQLVRVLLSDGPRSAQSLISRKVRQHFEGEVALSEAQVARVGSRIRESWSDILLGCVADAVSSRLAERSGVVSATPSPKEVHALRMVFAAEGNRRMLRKILKSHFAGERDFINKHPINLGWLNQHPRLQGSAWCEGFKYTHESHDLGWLTITLEQDPLEVLRMGTYVGTCLGLGGSFAHSAAAIMMDGNKHVAYCKDRKGVVLARQLLVMSEDEELWCFEVYPTESSDELVNLFSSFDRALAASMGVSVFDPEANDDSDAEDRILPLLSSEWWNDHPIQVPGE